MSQVPIAEASGGFSLNGALDSALSAWGKVEQIKAQKAAAGLDQTQAKLVPELENGATRVIAPQVGASADASTITIAGVKMSKSILLATAGILATLVVAKKVL